MPTSDSGGNWRRDKARELLDATDQTLQLWSAGGLDFDELADDIAAEVRMIGHINDELTTVADRINRLYRQADPTGIFLSGPGMQITLAAGILGRLGDPDRFANLAGVRAFTGLVPSVSQSGNTETHGSPTKSGDPGLRRALYLAAEHARRVDPTLAAKYHRLVVDRGKHHTSAICHLAAQLVTRLAACWRNDTPCIIRDTDGRAITPDQGRQICRRDWTVPPEIRRCNTTARRAKQLKQRTGRRDQKSTSTAAPATDPSTSNLPTTPATTA